MEKPLEDDIEEFDTKKFIRRDEAALRLGMSVGELRRRERLGHIKPVARGSKNKCLYLISDVEDFKDALYKQKDKFTPDQAAIIFQLLEQGKTRTQCVIEAKIHPEIVDTVAQHYATLSGGLMISQAGLKTINSMTMDGPLPVGTEKEIIELIEYLGKATCLECHKKPRAFCHGCVKTALKKARSMAAEKNEDEDEL